VQLKELGRKLEKGIPELGAGWRWLALAALNTVGSVVLTPLFFVFYNKMQAWAPGLISPIPPGSWPGFMIAASLLAGGFTLEIVLVARSAIYDIERRTTDATKEAMKTALKEEHLEAMLSQLLSGIDNSPSVHNSAGLLVEHIREFAYQVAHRQRALLFWLVSEKLPEFMAEMHRQLQRGTLEIHSQDEIDAIAFQLSVHKRFSCAETTIPDAVDKNWSRAWRKLLSTFPDKGISGKYYFVTSEQVLRSKIKSLRAVANYVAKYNVQAYWCDLETIRSVNASEIKFDALEWYEDGIFIKFSGLEKEGDWSDAKHLTMNIGEHRHHAQVHGIIQACESYGVLVSSINDESATS
jgi:hypothetical protein